MQLIATQLQGRIIGHEHTPTGDSWQIYFPDIRETNDLELKLRDLRRYPAVQSAEHDSPILPA
jgi:hypothetical protein